MTVHHGGGDLPSAAVDFLFTPVPPLSYALFLNAEAPFYTFWEELTPFRPQPLENNLSPTLPLFKIGKINQLICSKSIIIVVD